MKKKSTIAVAAVLAVLAVAVAVLSVLSGKDAEKKQLLRDNAQLLIVSGGEEYTLTMEEFLSLEQREIQANYKKNGKEPEARVFYGVPFAQVLRAKHIDPAGAAKALFSASDAYASLLPMEDALDEDNCFIVADSGADGPFRMILARDQFSQRWCKLLTDVTLT